MTERANWRRDHLPPDLRLVQTARAAIRLQGAIALDIQATGQLDLARTLRDRAALGALAALQASGEVTIGTAVSPDGIVKATWHRPSERPEVLARNRALDQADMLRPRSKQSCAPQNLLVASPTTADSGGARG